MEVGSCAGSGCSGTVDNVSGVNAVTFFKLGSGHSVVVNTVHVSVFYFDYVSASAGRPSNVCDNSVCGAFDVEGSSKVNSVMFTPRTVNGVFSHSVGACNFAIWCRVVELHFSPSLGLTHIIHVGELLFFGVSTSYDVFYEHYCLR